MKKLRDSESPEIWGHIWVPDDVKALLDLMGYWLDLYAVMSFPGGRKNKSFDLSVEDSDGVIVWKRYNQINRRVLVRMLTEWVRGGMQ